MRLQKHQVTHSAGGSVSGCSHSRNRWAAPRKVNVKPPYDPGAALLDSCPERWGHIHKNCVSVHCGALSGVPQVLCWAVLSSPTRKRVVMHSSLDKSRAIGEWRSGQSQRATACLLTQRSRKDGWAVAVQGGLGVAAKAP